MTKHMSVRQTCLITTLNVGVALLATAGIADAKHRHNNDSQYNGASPHFVVSGQPANKKRVLRDRKDKKKEAKCKKQDCKTPPAKPVADAPATNPKTITISNGVTTYTLPFDPRFSVEVTKPGSITVHSGDRTVTLPGGSITVHGQTMSKSLVERAGLQAIVNSHGDTVFAVKPPPDNASVKPAGNTPVQDTSLGGQLKGVVKDIGNGLENLGVGFISIGGPTPQEPKTGTITQE